jgi:DNA topoisomerase VI subunit B
MKIVELKPVLATDDSLTVNLQGLTKKHARQMHKEVASSVKKLTRTFAHLLAKEQRAQDKQQRKDAKASVHNLMLKLHVLLAQSTALAPPLAHPVAAARTHAA